MPDHINHRRRSLLALGVLMLAAPEMLPALTIPGSGSMSEMGQMSGMSP